jgi:type VI secretion system protein VasD
MGVKRFGFGGLVGAALSASLACSHSPPPAAAAATPCPSPEPLRVSVQASPRLNPGDKGEALATVVRLYQLKGAGKLTAASFDELLDHDRDALGEDFLSAQEMTINPNDKLEPPVARNADANYLAAVALFRQPAGTTWRAILKLPAPDPQHCHATADHHDGSAAPRNLMRIVLDENRLELR